jgi:sarcosine oxidase subunit gamma
MSEQTTNQSYVYAQGSNLMDQLPAASSEIGGESPLAHVDLADLASAQRDSKGRVELTELAMRAHIVLRGNPENSGFAKGVESALGVALPDTLTMQSKEEVSIRWISPDEWLVIAPAEQGFAIEEALVNAVQGHCAIVNVSGGQTLLRLSGVNAQQVLQKSVPLDVHASVFPVGKVVTSVFAKTQAVISRSADDQWELVIRRSFADYAWLWLQDSSAEYGLIIKQDENDNS